MKIISWYNLAVTVGGDVSPRRTYRRCHVRTRDLLNRTMLFFYGHLIYSTKIRKMEIFSIFVKKSLFSMKPRFFEPVGPKIDPIVLSL